MTAPPSGDRTSFRSIALNDSVSFAKSPVGHSSTDTRVLIARSSGSELIGRSDQQGRSVFSSVTRARAMIFVLGDFSSVATVCVGSVGARLLHRVVMRYKERGRGREVITLEQPEQCRCSPQI